VLSSYAELNPNNRCYIAHRPCLGMQGQDQTGFFDIRRSSGLGWQPVRCGCFSLRTAVDSNQGCYEFLQASKAGAALHSQA
jgi:hypothetical protein